MWDKQPELVLPKIPFELFAGMAERGAKRMDAVDEQVGKTKGLFASLVAAPGHEDIKTERVNTYNNLLTSTYEQHKNDPRALSREITALAAQYANDPVVQTINKSYEWFNKNQPILWETKSKNGYVDAPGILDNNGNFQQNTQEYGYNTFDLTPYSGDVMERLQKTIAIKKEQRISKSNTKRTVDPTTGEVKYDTTESQKFWSDKNNLHPTLESIFETVTQDEGLVPEYRWMKKDFQHRYGDKWEEELARVIENAAVPNYFKWTDEKFKEQYATPDDDGNGGSKKAQGYLSGSATTISRDPYSYIDPETGQEVRLTTYEQVQDYSKRLRDENKALKGQIISTFFTDETAADAFIATANGEEINVEKIKDPLQKSLALEQNAQLIYNARRQYGAQTVLRYAMEMNGLDPKLSLDDNLMLMDKKAGTNNYATAQNAAMERAFEVKDYGEGPGAELNNVRKELRLKLAGFTESEINEYFGIFDKVVKKKIAIPGAVPVEIVDWQATMDERINSLTALKNKVKGANSVTGTTASQYLQEQLNDYKEEKEQELNEGTYKVPMYGLIKKAVDGYLKKDEVEKAFQYVINADTDAMATAKGLARQAAQGGNFERIKTDNALPPLTEDQKTQIKTNEDFWKNARYYVRFDIDRNQYVVDVDSEIGSTSYSLEMYGQDQVGLTQIVNSIDKSKTLQFLTKQEDFTAQMNQSNGRYGNMAIYNKDQSQLTSISLKAPLEDVVLGGTGVTIKNSDYLFKLPEIDKKLVIQAPTYYDAASFLEAYQHLKESGASEAEIKTAVAKLVTDAKNYQCVVFDGALGHINNAYFTTDSEAYTITATGKK
jgi:hypothetical protein